MTSGFTPVEKKARRVRTDEDYANDDLLRGLKVLEALQGTSFETVSIKRVQERTGFPYDFCYRALRTFRLAGYVKETPKGWTLTARIARFSERFLDLAVSEPGGSDS